MFPDLYTYISYVALSINDDKLIVKCIIVYSGKL